jgi:hypothetical protein
MRRGTTRGAGAFLREGARRSDMRSGTAVNLDTAGRANARDAGACSGTWSMSRRCIRCRLGNTAADRIAVCSLEKLLSRRP